MVDWGGGGGGKGALEGRFCAGKGKGKVGWSGRGYIVISFGGDSGLGREEE